MSTFDIDNNDDFYIGVQFPLSYGGTYGFFNQSKTLFEQVKSNIRNLILTNHFEKPFHPEIGSGVRDMLFENMTPVTAHILARKIEDVILNFEPRARLVGVRAEPILDRNTYEVTIEFYVVNQPTELVDLSVMLERLR